MPRSIGEILADGDFNDAIVQFADTASYAWWDSTGNRASRYSSFANAFRAALRSGIYDVMLVIEYPDGTYGLSVQYDYFA